MTPEDTASSGTEIRVTLARFEAKLDVALAQHGARLDRHDSELQTMREERKDIVAKFEAKHRDNDARLLSLERLPTVSPKQLGMTVLGVITALGATAPFLDRLYS